MMQEALKLSRILFLNVFFFFFFYTLNFEEQLTEDVKILINTYSSIDNILTLIDKVKNLLANVDQAPSKSMQDALLPSMKALVTNELFSCILHY